MIERYWLAFHTHYFVLKTKEGSSGESQIHRFSYQHTNYVLPQRNHYCKIQSTKGSPNAGTGTADRDTNDFLCAGTNYKIFVLIGRTEKEVVSVFFCKKLYQCCRSDVAAVHNCEILAVDFVTLNVDVRCTLVAPSRSGLY